MAKEQCNLEVHVILIIADAVSAVHVIIMQVLVTLPANANLFFQERVKKLKN